MADALAQDAVLGWYNSVFSRRVDLVGDYAGSELFFVEFDSLLLQCFTNPKLDFSSGFQLLHAVHIVEKLLQNLLSKKCQFQIICFDQNEDLCIPPKAAPEDYSKYAMARSVIIRHLVHNLKGNDQIVIRRFSSFTDAEFVQYLDDTGCYFIMCHDGASFETTESRVLGVQESLQTQLSSLGLMHESEGASLLNSSNSHSCVERLRKVHLRAMISWFVNNEYNVALINELEFADSKAMTVVLEFSGKQGVKDFSAFYCTAASRIPPVVGMLPVQMLPVQTLKSLVQPSERDVISVLALQSAMEKGQLITEEVSAFLLHTAALEFLQLGNRMPLASTKNAAKHIRHILHSFANNVESLLRDNVVLEQLNTFSLPSNLADLVDGFFLVTLTQSPDIRDMLLTNTAIQEKYQGLLGVVSQVSGQKLVEVTADAQKPTSILRGSSPVPSDQEVLPFKNAVFDKHLAPVHLHLVEHISNGSTSGQTKVFKELSHWHNHKKDITVKKPPQKLGFFARRRNDWFMAEMHAYAASLTNAAGKVLDPETIVVSKRQKASVNIKADSLHKSVDSRGKTGKNPKNPTKKGGKAAALASAAAVQAENAQSKEGIDFWKSKYKELLSQPDLQIRYTTAHIWFNSLHQLDLMGPEVELFKIDCLLRLWIESCKGGKVAGANTAALIWDAFLRLSKTDSGLTPEIVASLSAISKLLGFPELNLPINATNRPLPFSCGIPRPHELKALKAAFVDLAIPDDATTFQLEHCGPYFDRAIDSAPDARVPFHPDAWQRKVLDSIDEKKSLFVVAPTSAGKTFISFYAMKQVLMDDDDGVVVYVAPTKALVNQIAAEIQARFSKVFKYPAGKSVWAIHTRDYRINNATGCQVLVTVPHVLQIMLLAPSHAEKKNSWSCRIKRIIFDEVHCIGQAEDGVIWEQLLLQSPCPIIALSATVGNQKEFSSWLGSTQEANGNELVSIEHHHRYSDLRKFIYISPQHFCFAGLPDHPIIHTPGLDGMDAFKFVHPVASLSHKSRGMPKDLNFEARDCLRLWQTMNSHATEEFSVPSRLNPNQALPKVIRKIDIHRWEEALKAKLLEWMNNNSSPFDKVLQDLSKELASPAVRSLLATKHTCDERCDSRKVNAHSVLSTILPALSDLHAKDALPAIVFNYDRGECEKLMRVVVTELENSETLWKETNAVWKKKVSEYEKFTKDQEAAKAKVKGAKGTVKKKATRRVDGNDSGDDERVSKIDLKREAGAVEISKWAGFDPHAPIEGFHFADTKKLSPSELYDYQRELRRRGIDEWLVSALGRGIAVHHAGMNRKYRQVVEILFRKSYLRVVIATGTLALGINMPCKTVVFAGDSVFLTALNFRQCAGRAGRRGFDVLGNILFLGIQTQKVFRLLSSRLPDLNGHFPITTSLVLRLATLLHGSNGSQFAVQTINSIFSQPRLYLGSPNSKMAVLHHLRFSIEYLRRQSLLDVDGSPINFAGCVSHLYYTENSAWAFHVLLSSGYFHKLCQGIDANHERVCSTIMLVLSHIFGRKQFKLADEEFSEELVKRSSSIVFLPSLPKEAEEMLQAHNDQTLSIFKTYVGTFADQHLKEPDDTLPLSKMKIGSAERFKVLPTTQLRTTAIRSPFVALSGHDDDFDSISDLCSTVRSGVFLEEAVVPYLPIHPESTVHLNAYLYDFYKHGDVKTLERANKIRRSDVWFLLNDFSLVLATITTSLTNFMKPSPGSEADMVDLMGTGDALEELEDEKAAAKNGDKGALGAATDEDGEESLGEEESDVDYGNGLPKVLKAFQTLREVFDEKFKKMWA